MIFSPHDRLAFELLDSLQAILTPSSSSSPTSSLPSLYLIKTRYRRAPDVSPIAATLFPTHPLTNSQTNGAIIGLEFNGEEAQQKLLEIVKRNQWEDKMRIASAEETDTAIATFFQSMKV